MEFTLKYGTYKFDKNGEIEWEWEYIGTFSEQELNKFIQENKLSYNSVTGVILDRDSQHSEYKVTPND